MPEGSVVRLCGRFSVSLGDRRVDGGLRGTQSRVLLAFLVANRHRSIRREELIEAIWCHTATAAGSRAALAVLLSRMRPAIEPGRIDGRDPLTLELPAPVEVDIEQARAALASASLAHAGGEPPAVAAEHASRALRLVRDGLAIDHDAPWVDDLRREVEGIGIGARERLVGALLADGGEDPAQAERVARELVSIAPFRESGQLALMRVLESRGEVPEALRAYDRFRRLLADELGTFPGRELRETHARLLAATDGAVP